MYLEKLNEEEKKELINKVIEICEIPDYAKIKIQKDGTIDIRWFNLNPRDRDYDVHINDFEVVSYGRGYSCDRATKFLFNYLNNKFPTYLKYYYDENKECIDQRYKNDLEELKKNMANLQSANDDQFSR